MAKPKATLDTEVTYFILRECEFRGVAPDELRTNDLQALAYGIRIAAIPHEGESPEHADLLRRTADAIDSLSDLEEEDIAYLLTIAP